MNRNILICLHFSWSGGCTGSGAPPSAVAPDPEGQSELFSGGFSQVNSLVSDGDRWFAAGTSQAGERTLGWGLSGSKGPPKTAEVLGLGEGVYPHVALPESDRRWSVAGEREQIDSDGRRSFAGVILKVDASDRRADEFALRDGGTSGGFKGGILDHEQMVFVGTWGQNEGRLRALATKPGTAGWEETRRSWEGVRAMAGRSDAFVLAGRRSAPVKAAFTEGTPFLESVDTGTRAFRWRWDGPPDSGGWDAVVALADGTWLAAGANYEPGDGHAHAWLACVGDTGVLQWQDILPRTGGVSYAMALVNTPLGPLVLVQFVDEAGERAAKVGRVDLINHAVVWIGSPVSGAMTSLAPLGNGWLVGGSTWPATGPGVAKLHRWSREGEWSWTP